MFKIQVQTLSVAAALLVLVGPFTAHAESIRVSDAFRPGDSDSKWVVGIAAGTVENPYINEDSKDTFAVPNIEYRGEKFFVKDDEIGYNLVRKNGFGAGLVVSGKGTYLSFDDEYEDNEQLTGIEERDMTADAGIYLLHTTELGQFRVRLLDEITGEHSGNSADASYTFDLNWHQWNINPTLGLAWESDATVDHFYGVSEQEANRNRAAYKGESATTWYTGIRGRYTLTKHWDVNLSAYYVRMGSGITDSSLIEEDQLYATSVGVNYNF